MDLPRRSFLGTLAGLTVGYALAPALRAAEASGKPLGLALCGLGGYSNGELSPALLETKNVKLVAAITGTRAKGVKLGKLHGFDDDSVYSYDQWDKVAANKAIDIVYVVTPPGVHARNVIDAFGAGKHVICEKPMATSVAECDAMMAAGKKAGKRLAIGYRLYYDPYHQELIRLAKTREFGPFMKMTSANGYTLRRKSWRIEKQLAGGGALLQHFAAEAEERCGASTRVVGEFAGRLNHGGGFHEATEILLVQRAPADRLRRALQRGEREGRRHQFKDHRAILHLGAQAPDGGGEDAPVIVAHGFTQRAGLVDERARAPVAARLLHKPGLVEQLVAVERVLVAEALLIRKEHPHPLGAAEPVGVGPVRIARGPRLQGR